MQSSVLPAFRGDWGGGGSAVESSALTNDGVVELAWDIVGYE